jgi:hypothetical protein
MAITYEPIVSTTLTSATANVVFGSIPNTYTDLVLIINNYFSSSSNPYISLQFNSDTTSNYTSTHLEGDGSAASSNRFTSDTLMYFGYNVASSTTPSNGMAIINIMNYSNTTTFKTVLGRVSIINGTKPGVSATVGLWRKTPEAINSILIRKNAGNLNSGCVLTLYGILKA